MQAGQIFQTDLGNINTPAIIGHEQGNKRPCIVLKVFADLNLCIIVPLTRTENNYYYTYKLRKNIANLPETSFVLCHQIRTVSFDRFAKQYGELEQRDFDTINEIIIDMFAI